MQYNRAVAQRSKRPGFSDAFDDFERVFDSLFDDLLIAPWRGSADLPDEDAQVIDLGDRYEVRMARLNAEPDQLEIEATERRLIVRVINFAGNSERAVNFPHHVEAGSVTAALQDDALIVVLPKRRPRKIKVA